MTTQPILISSQGSFAAGGTVLQESGVFDARKPDRSGQTLHGDHAYVRFQIPPSARDLPLVFLHGHLQSGRTWETTPDGREGFDTLFLRRGFGVYAIDQPRRGRGAHGPTPYEIEAPLPDQHWFNHFRLGIWPEYFDGVAFARDEEALNQYYRQTTPYTAPFDRDLAARSVAATFEKTGPGVLVSHSQGGGIGWHAKMLSDNIKGIVSYECGSNFPFPEGEVPPTLPSSGGPLEPVAVSLERFLKLTEVPIVIYYGDFIPAEPMDNPGQDQWRVRLDMARIWAETVNRRGGDATVVHLPDLGVTGNTHFPFSDTNSLEVAEVMSDFLASRGLDRRTVG